MNKTAYTAFFVGALLTTASASAAQADATTKKPCAVLLGTNTVDLGTVMKYETKSTEFRICNAGEAPLTIKAIISTCSCISGKASKPTLLPKEEGVITVLLKASEVHDSFTRSCWVFTDDPKKARIMLTVKGECVPVFQGLPHMPVALRAMDATVAWTNEITLTASETNTFLGLPTLSGEEFAKIDVAVKTNVAEKMSYVIRTVIQPIDPDLHVATVTFPVVGKPGTDPSPIRLQFQTQIGAQLHITPNKMLLNPAGNNTPRRFAIQPSGSAKTNLLSWSPVIEGVDISFLPSGKGGMRPNLLLTIKVSDEAAQRLLKENTELTFTYPNHKPAKLSFGPIAGAK